MSELTYNDTEFFLDGKPFRILSGAIHYFRVPRAYWHDRLLKLKECGFNTVETYVAWNLHETRDGEFDFSGELDLAAFLSEAKALGLYAILRPGPYICAEWEFGGFPGWLRSVPGIRLRCDEEKYLFYVRRYLSRLFDVVRPFFAGNGGNLILVQVENEYGSFGDDKVYLSKLVDMYKELDVRATFYTADGTEHYMLRGGLIPGILSVSNFGSHPKENFDNMRAFRPHQPNFCGEFWCGWFDHWTEEHHVRPVDDLLADYKELLDAGASVNYYMFHGGTNFGFMNGSNFDRVIQPTTTSYDYCAPLSEAGDRTAAYWGVRKMMEERFGALPAPTATETPKAAYGKVTLTEGADLLDFADTLPGGQYASAPKYMEELGQNVGYTLYSTVISGGVKDMPLIIDGLGDRANIYVGGKYAETRCTMFPEEPKYYTVPEEDTRIDVLVENLGRVNYGPMFGDRKGMHALRFERQFHFGYRMLPLPLDADQMRRIPFGTLTLPTSRPTFLRGTLTVAGAPADSFLRLPGFTKGCVFVNGHNIGRYWNSVGPQKTLYVPAPFLKAGENEIVVFESDRVSDPTVEFLSEPILG